jgi:hypothetical protein
MLPSTTPYHSRQQRTSNAPANPGMRDSIPHVLPERALTGELLLTLGRGRRSPTPQNFKPMARSDVPAVEGHVSAGQHMRRAGQRFAPAMDEGLSWALMAVIAKGADPPDVWAIRAAVHLSD